MLRAVYGSNPNHSPAANFLVESSGHRFRLFHQALNDVLLRDRQRRGRTTYDQRAISERLIRYGRLTGWAAADRYLSRLSKIGATFDALGQRYLVEAADGRTPTAVGVDQSIRQLTGYLALPVAGIVVDLVALGRAWSEARRHSRRRYDAGATLCRHR